MEKGELNGICNMSSCTSGLPANWYNHGSYKHYCTVCATRLNNDPYNHRDAMRLFGHNLCTIADNSTIITNEPEPIPFILKAHPPLSEPFLDYQPYKSSTNNRHRKNGHNPFKPKR